MDTANNQVGNVPQNPSQKAVNQNNQPQQNVENSNQTQPTPTNPTQPTGQKPDQVQAQDLPETPQQVSPGNANQPKPAANDTDTNANTNVQKGLSQQNNNVTGIQDQPTQVSPKQQPKPQMPQSPSNESQDQAETEQTAVQTMTKDDVELESNILADIRTWLSDMIEVTKGREEGGLNKLLDKLELLKNFSQKISADDTKKALTKSEKEEFVNIYNEVCKDIEHNFIEVQDEADVNGSFQSLSLVIFLMDFGFEYLCILLGQLYTEEELLSRIHIRDHYFAAQKLLDERRVVIGRMIDPFVQYVEDNQV